MSQDKILVANTEEIDKINAKLVESSIKYPIYIGIGKTVVEKVVDIDLSKAKKGCSKCYGRGFEGWLIKHTDNFSTKTKKMKRCRPIYERIIQKPCSCILNPVMKFELDKINKEMTTKVNNGKSA